MTAMVLTAEPAGLERRPVPTPRADQVLVDVELCGICGSDLHAPDLPQVYRGGFILGHEPAGRIAAVGREVTGWRVGQRVSINPNGDICGVCAFCRTDSESVTTTMRPDPSVDVARDFNSQGLYAEATTVLRTSHRMQWVPSSQPGWSQRRPHFERCDRLATSRGDRFSSSAVGQSAICVVGSVACSEPRASG
jgi:D-arabinose 1-dehydrogenase-like Zn-dependent alcohol dehydrogenase